MEVYSDMAFTGLQLNNLLLATLSLALAFFLGVVIPFGKWLAARWREPLEEEVALRTKLQARIEALEAELGDAKLKAMFLEAENKRLKEERESYGKRTW